VTLFKILNPSIFLKWIEATLFKVGNWIDYSKSHPKGKKFPPKGAWDGSRDRFFANASAMAPHQAIKIPPPKKKKTGVVSVT